MRFLDGLMWIMFLISSALAVMTIIVTFGMVDYTSQLSYFTNLLLLEISLAVTLFLWGINSLYKMNGKKTFVYYFIMGVILLGFIFMGVY